MILLKSGMVFPERLLAMMESRFLIRSNLSVQAFSIAPTWLHHRFYVNQFYVEGRGQIDIESVSCVK